MELFVVHHVQETGDADEIKLIGIYSTRMRAEEAIRRLTPQPGFRAAPDAFHIDRYRVDEDYWPEGFVADAGPRLNSRSEKNA
jgi:hypothetical protein